MLISGLIDNNSVDDSIPFWKKISPNPGFKNHRKISANAGGYNWELDQP